jgi:Tol biopolymer transport system component
LTKLDAGRHESGHGFPQFLPDGNHFLFFVASSDLNFQGIYSASLDNPDIHTQIVRTGGKAVFVPATPNFPDYLLWLQDQTLVAQRFNTKSLKLEGDPASVAEKIAFNPSVPIRAAYWASDAGSLAYFSASNAAKRRIVWITRDGKEVRDAAAEDVFVRIAVAPGGERFAAVKLEQAGQQSNADVWVRESARDVMPRLTFDPGADDMPAWSPDGKQLAFSSNREGLVQIQIKDASGAGKEETLTASPTAKNVLDWSKDGKYILYREQNAQTGRDLMAIPVAPVNGERKPFPVVQTQFAESTGAISPDGRWVAYCSNDSGLNQIYVQAFPGSAGAPPGRWQVSTGGGYDVRWRGDGKELYYESLDGRVVAVAVQPGPDGVRADSPRDLFSANFVQSSLHEFDVTSDGQRFLMILEPKAQSTDRLTVVSNWQAALRK